MNGIMNETQLWYCDKCNETIHFSGRLRHFSSNSLEHKKTMVLLLTKMS